MPATWNRPLGARAGGGSPPPFWGEANRPYGDGWPVRLVAPGRPFLGHDARGNARPLRPVAGRGQPPVPCGVRKRCRAVGDAGRDSRAGGGGMSLDHGVLNAPLRKRGNLERQIDRSLADQRRDREARAKAARRQFTADWQEALGLIDRMTDEHVARLAEKAGRQKRSVRKWLREQAGIDPQLVVKALREGGAE